MKKKSILLPIVLASILQAEPITSIEYVNLTKISTQIANETVGIVVGDELNEKKIDNAIKRFFKFNYFDDIQVKSNKGKLEFIFKEKPSIANVQIKGYKTRNDDIEDLKKEIGITKGILYSAKRVKKAKVALLNELQKAGYINSVVEVEVENINNNSVSIVFDVNKGYEITIKKVDYFGARNLDADDFEKVTANKEEDLIPWLFTQNNGELRAEQLSYDAQRIKELYLEHGFLDAKVADPFLKVDFASDQADLDFNIKEGKQYKTNLIKIQIDPKILDPKKLYPELKLVKGKVFNIKKFRNDIKYIKTKVANLGYAFAQVKFDIQKNKEKALSNITYNVIPGDKVYINDVIISGNGRTLDRVIRRDIYLAPGDLFNLTDFNDSKDKLNRSGFFNEVSIEQKRVSTSKMDLIVKVKETGTGNVIFGGGYGSYDGLMINASYNERNIFGSGIGSSLSTDLSKKTSNFFLRFTNPSIGDSKYNGDFDIHSRKIEINNDNYNLTKNIKGFTLATGREIFRDLRAGARYRLDFIKEIYNYNHDFKKDPRKKYYENTDYVTSSITPYINFDNTNNYYFPTAGIKTGSSLEYAGIGGDSKYIKSSSYFKYYYSLMDSFDLDWILRYKAQAKFLINNGKINQGDSLYLGGVGSLRGYKSYAFGPNNDSAEVQAPYKSMLATSVEFSVPLVPKARLRWGLFYDYGMIGENNLDDVKKSSTGILFEWVSPFGLLQLFFAKPLDAKPNDKTSSFEFSLGQSF